MFVFDDQVVYPGHELLRRVRHQSVVDPVPTLVHFRHISGVFQQSSPMTVVPSLSDAVVYVTRMASVCDA